MIVPPLPVDGDEVIYSIKNVVPDTLMLVVTATSVKCPDNEPLMQTWYKWGTDPNLKEIFWKMLTIMNFLSIWRHKYPTIFGLIESYSKNQTMLGTRHWH